MVYDGSADKVPEEYWEYRLVEEHFRGNWLCYWQMPEPWVNMILGFRSVENEAGRLKSKRLERDQKLWQTNKN